MQQFDQWLLSLTFGLRIAELAKDEGTVAPTPLGTGARAPTFTNGWTPGGTVSSLEEQQTRN